MQAHHAARPTSFDPDALRMLYAAYDAAWSEIAPSITPEPAAIEWARTSLATIVLGLGSTGAVTPDGLRTMAVAVFCNKHRVSWSPTGARPVHMQKSRHARRQDLTGA
jgi:hypothetical protein